MKLISMTDFVIKSFKELDSVNYRKDLAEYVNNTHKYAKFLKENLKLEMFICTIPEPEPQGGYAKDGTFVGGYDEKWIEEYYEAKDKVLFEGFELKEELEFVYKFNYKGKEFNVLKNELPIEWLVGDEIELTPNAIKRIFG